MNHACINDADVMRLKTAGCLTCESEDQAALTAARPPSRGGERRSCKKLEL
jgi:hypothetical protein